MATMTTGKLFDLMGHNILQGQVLKQQSAGPFCSALKAVLWLGVTLDTLLLPKRLVVWEKAVIFPIIICWLHVATVQVPVPLRHWQHTGVNLLPKSLTFLSHTARHVLTEQHICMQLLHLFSPSSTPGLREWAESCKFPGTAASLPQTYKNTLKPFSSSCSLPPSVLWV